MSMTRNMKATVIVATIALLSVNASAQVSTSFQWSSSASQLQNASAVNIAAGGATILTYLSTDTTPNFDTGALFQENYGNDSFYKALGNSLSGRYATAFMEGTDSAIVGKYAYFVVLDLPHATFTDPMGINSQLNQIPGGTYFGFLNMIDPAHQVANLGEPPLPSQQFTGLGYVQTTFQVIPEPGTMAFLVLGVLTLGARRFLRTRRED